MNRVIVSGLVSKPLETKYGLFSGFTTQFNLLIGKGCEIPFQLVEKDHMKINYDFKKGDEILVEGELHSVEWFNSYGHRKREVKLIPSNIQVLNRVKTEEGVL